MDRRKLGQYGENIAAQFLERRGFSIVWRNFQTRWGEIDLVAEKDSRLHFVEVKTRSGVDYGAGEEAIGRFKQLRLLGAAKMYIAKFQPVEKFYQIDSINVLLNKAQKTAKFRYLENIVSES
ncbi:MAG: YraN family protein [Candidatus Magasanikbacteria bacterium]|nr:YraN family protein [Candidatus Magasanikbacteria bacterium]